MSALVYRFQTTRFLKASGILLVCSIIFPPMPVSALTDVSYATAGITNQAVIEKHLKHSDQSILRAKLLYNNHGYRLVPLSEGNEFELIVNTDNDTVSIIDRKQKTITEIDLAFEVSSGPQFITLSQIRRLVKLPGQLDSVPCSVNGGRKTGLFIVEELELEVWSCNEASDDASSSLNDEVIKQHFSVEQGRVVYSLFSGGFEYHMRDIQPVKSEVLFTKPENFRNTSIEEFFGIVKPIGVYTPSASSQKLETVQP